MTGQDRIARSRRGAFTLLELILAMLMVALLSLTLYTCISIAYKSKAAAERTVNSTREAMSAIDIVVRDLEGAMLPPQDPSVTASCSGDFEATHDGDNDTVDFYSLGNDSYGDASPFAEGIRRIILTVRTDLSSPTLVRQVIRNTLSSNTPTPDEETLCANVRSFNLQYWDGSTWQQSWDSEAVNNFIPLQVRIELTIAVSADRLKSRDTAGDTHLSRVVALPMSRPF